MIFDYTLNLAAFLPKNMFTLVDGAITLADFSMRVGLALVLGSLIGAEREWRQKLAGLKTNALVCVGSALFTCIGYQIAASSQTDPTRIVGQIASGIGFLGAGAILRDGMNIRGLTTAATVWCAAAIGSMAGAGMLVHAVIGTGFIFGCNLALKEMAGMIFKSHNADASVEQSYIINFYTTTADPVQRKEVVNFLGTRKLNIRAINIEPVSTGFHWVLTVQYTSVHSESLDTEGLSNDFWGTFSSQLNWRIG